MRTSSTLRQQRNSRVDAWQASGGIVLTSSDRAARSLTAAFHDARQSEGRLAWQTPAIFSWESWIETEWQVRNMSGLLLLNPLQEKFAWLNAISRSSRGQNGRAPWLLNPGRLAASAQRAYQLLCGYAPSALKSAARLAWQGDATEFSRWIEAFQSNCRRDGLVSRSQLALELGELLGSDESPISSPAKRPALLLVGFDRLLPSQTTLLDLWGEWKQDVANEANKEPKSPAGRFYKASDGPQEIRTCVAWLRERISENSEARLMVVVSGLEARRGELERELLAVNDMSRDETSNPASNQASLHFEFSMGIPLGQMGHARSALLLLRWLNSPLSEAEVDWLLGSGHSIANAREEQALAEAMFKIRRRGRERPSWRLNDFLSDFRKDSSIVSEKSEEGDWAAKMTAAVQLLQAMPARQSPLDWVEATRALLEAAGWPGYRPLSSIAFQVCERLQRVLEDCGSLGFTNHDDRADGMDWDEFAAALADAVAETVFAAESSDAPIQITGPLESAGQVTDSIWFLGADEDGWPGRGQPHPLLPIGLQRDTGMPHASPQADWNLAQEATLRLLGSAEKVVFSYARQSVDTEMRPSRLALRLLGVPAEIPSIAQEPHHDRTESFTDLSRIPFPHVALRGGAAILTHQSNCPFQAFATGRLEANTWEPASTGLNAKQRGILLHNLLHRIWSGATRGGISTHSELMHLPSLREFVAKHVWRTMRECFDQEHKNALPDRFPARYLELESERLTRLVIEWLEYERERVPFTVARTEANTEVTVAGLTLKLRLDRIDTVSNAQNDSASLIVDYKSSEAGPKDWMGERPENIQLPLYATFVVPEEASDLEGLVIAQVRPAKMKFTGRLRDAGASLLQSLSRTSGMIRNPLIGSQLEAWRQTIERLGENFIAGNAEVDPREPRKTCEHCHLHAVCRINENNLLDLLTDEDEAETSGEDNE